MLQTLLVVFLVFWGLCLLFGINSIILHFVIEAALIVSVVNLLEARRKDKE